MKIIVDGPDGAGKSTLIKKLVKIYKCDVLQMTEFGSKNVDDYVDKTNLDNVIWDRSFISEKVYPKYFGRISKLSDLSFLRLLNSFKSTGGVILIISNAPEILKRRLESRGEYDFLIDHISEINKDYVEIANLYKLPIISSDMSIKEITTIIEKESKNGINSLK